MSSFYCVITDMVVTIYNLEKWKKILQEKVFVVYENYTDILQKYGAKTIYEYYNIIAEHIRRDTLSSFLHELEMYHKEKALERIHYQNNIIEI